MNLTDRVWSTCRFSYTQQLFASQDDGIEQTVFTARSYCHCSTRVSYCAAAPFMFYNKLDSWMPVKEISRTHKENFIQWNSYARNHVLPTNTLTKEVDLHIEYISNIENLSYLPPIHWKSIFHQNTKVLRILLTGLSLVIPVQARKDFTLILFPSSFRYLTVAL